MPTQAASLSVALVEDEPILRQELAFQLGHLGFAVAAFENANQLYRHLAVRTPQLVVLDIGLEGEDGLSVCRHLREHNSLIGIVFVTARSLREQRIEGLEAGADAYLTKPIDIDELALILRRLAERTSWPAFDRRRSARTQRWRLDDSKQTLHTPNGETVSLTLTETRLLSTLIDATPNSCTYTQLGIALDITPDQLDKHRIEVIVSRLRAKILRGTGKTAPVLTDRNQGYRWSEDEGAPR